MVAIVPAFETLFLRPQQASTNENILVITQSFYSRLVDGLTRTECEFC